MPPKGKAKFKVRSGKKEELSGAQYEESNSLPKAPAAQASATQLSAPPLEFITITSRPATQKADFSYTIRSHAMQSFIHSKNNPKAAKTTAKEESAASEEAKSSGQLSGKFKLDSWSRKPRRRKVNLLPLTARNVEIAQDQHQDQQQVELALQPYATLPIPSNSARTQRSLYHCIHIHSSASSSLMLILVDNTAFRINAFAVNFDETWKPFSITDSALLHATLCLVAQHEDLLAGRESEENLFHKGEVMRLMNGRLRESGREISDADVTTVAMLVVLESMNGTFEAASAHRVGLLKMLKVRGGFWNFEPNPMLIRILSWADIVYSTRFGPPPQFPCLFTPDKQFFPQISERSILELSTIFSSPSAIELLQGLQFISTTIDLPNLTLETKKAISDTLYASEYQILSLEHQPQHFASHLEHAFTVASLLYLQLVFRELPNSSKVHHRLLLALLQILRSISWIEGERDRDVVLWIVFICAAASRDDVMRSEFVGIQRRLDPDVENQSLEMARERLRRVAWRESICGSILEKIWWEAAGEVWFEGLVERDQRVVRSDVGL